LDSVSDWNHFKQGEIMGRKGVSKRKPKQNKTSNGSIGNAVILPSRTNSPVQLLVKDNEVSHNKDGSVMAGSKKKNKKGR
jgi:hypothetical protein